MIRTLFDIDLSLIFKHLVVGLVLWGFWGSMSLFQKVKQYLKKFGHAIESSAPKSKPTGNHDAARLAEQLAAENRRKDADIQRYNEYLASERLREEQEENARRERIRSEERLQEQKILERRPAERERLGKEQAEDIRFEELRAHKQVNQNKLIEEQQAEPERLKKLRENERSAIEIERLKQIHALNQNETYIEYLREAERFRKDYDKNIKCDICGEWELGLINHRGQTYCERHIPTSRNTENEHKVMAGSHGSSRSYIKK